VPKIEELASQRERFHIHNWCHALTLVHSSHAELACKPVLGLDSQMANSYAKRYNDYILFGENNNLSKLLLWHLWVKITMAGKKSKLVRGLLAGFIWLGLISLGFGTSPKKTRSEIELARENLLISEATAERIANDLVELRNSPRVPGEIIDDYEIYLARVQAMVDEQRKVVSAMEKAYANHLSRKESAPAKTSEDLEYMLNPEIPEEDTTDEVGALDQEFNESLTEFDQMLLKEFDAIRAQSARKMRDLAEQADEVANRLRDKGVELDTGESGSSGDAGEQTKDGEEKAEVGNSLDESEEPTEAEREEMDKGENTTGSTEATVDKDVAAADESGHGGEGTPQEQKRRYDKADDDIVARQLREAAENETDPELKEKLWKEYEAYKKNTP
jgi:hypothetical protein